MINCTRCSGEGYQEYEEDPGRYVRDACYHCSTTGKIDEETHWFDRLGSVAATLASLYVDEQREARNSDPDGDGWDFCAYEYGMQPWDYYRVCVWDKQPEILEKLASLSYEDQQFLVALNEMPRELFYFPKEKELPNPPQHIIFDNYVADGDDIPF